MKEQIRNLRLKGMTYSEIQLFLSRSIPKSTLTYICKDLALLPVQAERIQNLKRIIAEKNRQKALAANKRIFTEKLKVMRDHNLHLGSVMKSRDAKLIALSMLYLGEGTKWKSFRGLQLGSSSTQILKMYINLLNACYEVNIDMFKARVQHRADQNPEELVNYWSKQTGITKDNFYPSYVDKRTIGQKTLKHEYKGVCTVRCAGTHIQLELEQIAGIISDALGGYSAVG